MQALKTGSVILCFILFLTGCTHSVIRGTLNGNIPLNGVITGWPFLDKGYAELNSPDNSIYCHGIMRPTHIPNFSYDCDEQEGSLVLDCNNNRTILAYYENDGCGKGFGDGFLDHGKRFHFVFYPAWQPPISDTRTYLSKLKNNNPPGISCTKTSK
jgi:hypothetical protein